jgi:hypothetical protein
MMTRLDSTDTASMNSFADVSRPFERDHEPQVRYRPVRHLYQTVVWYAMVERVAGLVVDRVQRTLLAERMSSVQVECRQIQVKQLEG